MTNTLTAAAQPPIPGTSPSVAKPAANSNTLTAAAQPPFPAATLTLFGGLKPAAVQPFNSVSPSTLPVKTSLFSSASVASPGFSMGGLAEALNGSVNQTRPSLLSGGLPPTQFSLPGSSSGPVLIFLLIYSI
jgi:hypothetical protein